ncbi:hypothetical protein BVY03_03980 [bacterium K02(2017)]|nr:hypothetical protein BVY03_03980 [bacterium K02(2017)]
MTDLSKANTHTNPVPESNHKPANGDYLSGKINVPGGLGIEYAKDFGDQFQLATSLSSWFAISQASVEGRYVFRRADRSKDQSWDFYAGVGVHALASPLLFPTVAPGANLSIGTQKSWDNGFFLGLDVGAMVLWAPPGSEGGGNEWGGLPTANLRLGHVWR